MNMSGILPQNLVEIDLKMNTEEDLPKKIKEEYPFSTSVMDQFHQV